MYCHLYYRNIIKITGIDAEKFLQNLLSNDVKNIRSGHLTYNLFLSPQGKVLYDFFIFNDGDNFYLDCHKKYTKEIIQKFKMYKLHSDVEISTQPELKVFISDEAIDSFYTDPRNANLGFRGYKEPISSAEDSKLLHTQREKQLKFLIPEFETDFSPGEFFALELEMDRINAINFEKGCYVGQEVVAKIKYRGKKKKHLACIALKDFVIINKDIFEKKQKVGTILNVHGRHALALMKNNS
jgi:folate-binding protein YgfZ